MNKSEFISEVNNKSGLTKKDCKLCLDAIISVIQEALKKGDCVTLSNFGKFKISEFKSKCLYNFKTKTTEIAEARKTATFKPCEKLKQIIK